MNNRETVKQALKNLQPIGNNLVSAFEIDTHESNGEYMTFHVAHNENYIVIGSIANVGMLPEFWIEKDDAFSLDQQLEAIYELITEALYNNTLDDLNGLIEL